MKKNIFLIMFLMFHENHAEQFMYPVAELQDSNQLLVVYQKSLDDIELWIWDTDEHCATKCLSSFLTPANLRLLPSGQGFSFIDAGYIKIKEFSKRSPRTLPIYEPIGLFSSINWIDDTTFYFVAREGDFFQIFQSDIEANVYRLTYDFFDALYPQKIGSNLFYIQRNDEGQSSIMRKYYNLVPMNYDFHTFDNQDIIIESSQSQLCFLKMINDHEGFYLQAPIEKKNEGSYTFSCFHFIQNNGTWENQKLFDFQIPIKYIIGYDRLHESIEPFLPNYTCKGLVFFVNWQEEVEQFCILQFDLATKNIKNITNQLDEKQQQKTFAPFLYKNKIFCGLIIKDSLSQNRLFNDGNGYFELPYFDQK